MMDASLIVFNACRWRCRRRAGLGAHVRFPDWKNCSGDPVSTARPRSRKQHPRRGVAREPHFVSDDHHRHAFAGEVRITTKTSPTSSGSSALVGSSNNRRSGRIASARAMPTRYCFCPPDNRAGNASRFSLRPTLASRASASSRTSAFGRAAPGPVPPSGFAAR